MINKLDAKFLFILAHLPVGYTFGTVQTRA